MTARQRVLPIKEFAKAMLEADGGFADRVKRFESRFGSADADTLAAIAQAGYFCWGNSEYRDGIVEVCRAIGMRKPTSFFYHGQITADRWNLLNAYAIGVQNWLGADLPLPAGIDGGRIQRINQWLSKRQPAKDALARLFLCNLVNHLMGVSFAKLGDDATPAKMEYVDFAHWYPQPNGTARHILIEKRKKRVRQEMSSAIEDAEELINGILQGSPPPCVHRFTRYLDIHITSIGALKWRGNLPSDDVPKGKWIKFLNEAHAGLRAWIDGALPRGELAITLHKALGRPTEQSKAMVRDFLLSEDRGAASDWLGRKAREEGTTAGAIFVKKSN